MLARRLSILVILLASVTAAGQTVRYVADDIPITLRSGPSLQNKILRTLSAGDRVEVIDVDSDAGYSHVRVASDGSDGWLLTRYLVAQPVARDRIAGVQKSLVDAQARVKDLEAQVASLTDELKQTRDQLEQTTSKNHDVTSQLQDIRSASANAIQLRDQNESLKRHIADSEQRIDRLSMENKELQSENRQQWFVVGAGVLLGGILIGLIAPHTKRKRRSSW